MKRYADAYGLRLALYTSAFPAAEADAFFADLRTHIAWEQHEIRVAGRSVPCPRLSAWQGDPGVRYRYSGITLRATGWSPQVASIRQRVESLAAACFNSVLLQLYRDGSDGMGWHSDDEPELGPEPCIASVSLGATRRFVLKHKRRRDQRTVDLFLEHGSLLIMAGRTQEDWRHALPKTRRTIGPRINLTFRRLPPAARASGRS